MDRRNFLRGLSAVGAVVASPVAPSLAAAAGRAETRRPPAPGDHAAAPLVQLENEHLSVALFSDATARIVDRKNRAEWRMGPVAIQEEGEIEVGHVWIRTGRSFCEQYPGRFRGQREGDNVRFWLMGREDTSKGSFLVRIALNGPWLELRLLEAEESLPSLVFPPPIESESLVLPMDAGRWIRKPLNERLFYTFFSQLNMRWFGGLTADRGWIAIFPEPNFVDSGVMLTEMSASPAWLKQLGRWQEPRSVQYRFIAGNYVDFALTYRQWAMDNGLHRSLADKQAHTPSLASLTQGRIISIIQAEPRHYKRYDEDILRRSAKDPLLGSGPYIRVTHEQARHCIQRLPESGLKQALVVIRGWIAGGYDYSHPDIWPPEPQLGGLAEFQELCRPGSGFTVALHDNYQDIYRQSPSWPAGIIQERNGARMPGGYWAGGQAYIVNARNGVQYARRNWKSISQLPMKAYFVDTTSTVQPYQSYQPGNTLTRAQDVAGRTELMKFFKSQGLVLGSEGGADFAAPFLDWNENRHKRNPGETIPLWPLVYHDAVVAARYHGGSLPMESAEARQTAPFWLEDMLWGYALLTGIPEYSQLEGVLHSIAQTQHVDSWFRKVATAAMTGHRFLTADASLEETSFSNGYRIVVNFAREPQSSDGDTIAPYGYRIYNSAATPEKGTTA